MGTRKVGNVARVVYTDLDHSVHAGLIGVITAAVPNGEGDIIYTVDPRPLYLPGLPFEVRDAYLWECGPSATPPVL